MPKIIKSTRAASAKSAAKTKVSVSKSVPKNIADSLFDDVNTSKVKAKPTATAAERRLAKAKLAKRAAAKEVKGLIGASGKATRKPKVVAKATVKAKPAAKKTRVAKTTRAPRAKKVVEAVKPVKTRFTKASLIAHLADVSGADKATSKLMLDGLSTLIAGSIAPRGLGTFTFPGLFKVVTRKVPARKGGKMVMNRFTGEEVKQKAKPASVRVKIRPMAGLKAAAGVGA